MKNRQNYYNYKAHRVLRSDVWELLAILSNLQKTSDVLLMWLSATMQKIYWEFIKMPPGNLLVN